jgi:hypothetical protein
VRRGSADRVPGQLMPSPTQAAGISGNLARVRVDLGFISAP